VTIFGTAIDVRPLFPRERRALLELLGSLEPDDWRMPTICPGWDVHDIVGHILHDYVRRLSGTRDGHHGAAPSGDESLPAYLARENEVFVHAARRCSPRVMTDLLAHLGPQLDALWSARDLDARADVDVSWAATDVPSPAWLDIAREYTEYWVHQQQVRDAVSCPGAEEPELMAPVADTFLRALPYTLRAEVRPEGTTVRFEVRGPAGGVWHAVRGADRWRMADGGEPAASVTMDQDTLWRLASRGITVEEARERASARGDPGLAGAATTLLSIIW
jgi:uncharacterized protein (TIGR03083 family)